MQDNEPVSKRFSPKSALICSNSRKAKILTTGIHVVFRGLKFEPDAEIGQISADFEMGRFGTGSNNMNFLRDYLDAKKNIVEIRNREISI